MHGILPEAEDTGGLFGRVQYWFACFFAIGWAGVVCGALVRQVVLGEHPCPLCVAQRIFMLLAATGAAYVVRTGLAYGAVGGRDYMTGWGLALVAVTAGAFASWRQSLLHVVPGGRGHGGEVFGLDPSVWALILFQASAVAVGVALACARVTAGRSVPAEGPGALRSAGLFALGFLGLAIAASLAAVFLEEGFHWFLPDVPTRYRFFSDVGIVDRPPGGARG
ncbi:disulfide bond formation protein B [Streptomyces sp. NPDC058674]|uniref:disulfide bond formation protein B n=1 Tax=Streptomyces sp. NPDC058674 TaxID=3346592 RepID=UPI00366518BD